MMNYLLIFSYLEELAAAGPDVIELVKDVIRAVNDFRAGKLTENDFKEIIDDATKVAADLFGAKTSVKTTVTTVAPS